MKKERYWNDPQGKMDRSFVSPFAETSPSDARPKYVTFEMELVDGIIYVCPWR